MSVPASVSTSVSVSAPVSAPVSVCVSVSVSGDLGLEDPLTLLCVVNEDIPTTCIIDLGDSSQFVKVDFVLNMNLPLVPKGKPEDLVLADGARAII